VVGKEAGAPCVLSPKLIVANLQEHGWEGEFAIGRARLPPSQFARLSRSFALPDVPAYNAPMNASRPLADSPWFWAYLFGTAALVALALAGPKFGPRQAQIEREYQGRTRAAQNLNGVEPDLEMSTAERTLITLRPLFIALAVITSLSWVVFWWTRRRLRIADCELRSAGNSLPFASDLTPDS
jgi:hypothetical protein